MDAPFGADRVDRDDVGVVQLRGGLGLDAEPGDLAGVDGGGERQDLQRHATAERALHGLVDDAHAAAPQLADDAEITESRSVRCRLIISDRRRSDRAGQFLDQMQTIEARPQAFGDRRVLVDPFFRVDRPACLHLDQIVSQHPRELIVLARSLSVFNEKSFAHAHFRPSSASLSRSIARAQSMRTAPEERSIRVATSSNFRSSRFRKMTTSR